MQWPQTARLVAAGLGLRGHFALANTNKVLMVAQRHLTYFMSLPASSMACKYDSTYVGIKVS